MSSGSTGDPANGSLARGSCRARRTTCSPRCCCPGASFRWRVSSVNRTGPTLVTRLFPAVVLLTMASLSAAQTPAARPPAPVEPVAAILNAFQSHDIVGLSDPHGNVQMQAFLLSLVRDPRLPANVNDFVVETESARYQD